MSDPTLYQDWQLRLSGLTRARQPAWRHLDFQRPVLSYLLKRYENDPIAQRPALFPVPAKLQLFQRTGVIQHHLAAKHLDWKIHTTEDAQQKMSTILQRIKKHEPQAALGAPANGKNFSLQDAMPDLESSVDGVINSIDASGLHLQLPGGNDIPLNWMREMKVELWMRSFLTLQDFEKIRRLDQLSHWEAGISAERKEWEFAQRISKILSVPLHLPVVLDVWRLHLSDPYPKKKRHIISSKFYVRLKTEPSA